MDCKPLTVIPQSVLRVIRSQACRYVDGDVSSVEAFHVIDAVASHPFNGTDLNTTREAFDRIVDQLIEDQQWLY